MIEPAITRTGTPIGREAHVERYGSGVSTLPAGLLVASIASFMTVQVPERAPNTLDSR